MPSISFFIPAYNCAATLSEAVASIFDGNFRSGDEVVIVNDGSTDQTADVIRSLQQHYPPINALAHRHNRGGGAARNTAVENARHDILFCLDSDNILAPASVPRLLEYLVQNTADVASFGELHYFVNAPSQVTHKWIFKPGQTSLADYLAGAVVPGASGNYLFTRQSWVKAHGYPESAGALDAWGFGLRQVASGQKMMVLQNSYYHHRYGHESYWVRESRRGQGSISLIALQLLIPFMHNLVPQDVDYVMGPEDRNAWFDRLEQRPLRMKSGERGISGLVEGAAIESPSNVGLVRRLANALARRLNVKSGR